MTGLIGIALLLVLYYFLIRYYHQAWKCVPRFDGRIADTGFASEKISVIVPARNEEAVIEKCILSLLQQSYPKSLLEIIIVDDHSTDETAAIVKRYATEGVQLISPDQESAPGRKMVSFKKKAIATAIQAATGSLIVTTDADCIFHEHWIDRISTFHRHSHAVFIVGPVKMVPGNSLLSVFQSIDFSIMQGITAGSVFRKFHSMCNGANLAYERALFFEVGGFEHIDHIASGDDMLLMQKIAQRYPDAIAYLQAKEAIVETLSAPDWRTFFHQRIRWASKTGQYNDKWILFVLTLVYLLNLSLFILLAGSVWNPEWLMFFIIGLVLKTLIEWRFVRSVLRYFNLPKLLRWFPLFQPLHIVYIVVAGFFSSFSHYEWKGRRVR